MCKRETRSFKGCGERVGVDGVRIEDKGAKRNEARLLLGELLVGKKEHDCANAA